MLITLIVVLFAVFLLLSWIYFWQSRAWKEELEFYEAEAARRQAEPEQMPLNFRQPVSTPRLHDDLAFILMDDDEPQQPSLLPEDEDAAAVAETPAPAKRSKPAAPPIELPADPEPLPAESTLWDAPNLLLTPHAAGGRVVGAVERILANAAAVEATPSDEPLTGLEAQVTRASH